MTQPRRQQQQQQQHDPGMVDIGGLLSHVQMMETNLSIKQQTGSNGSPASSSTTSLTMCCIHKDSDSNDGNNGDEEVVVLAFTSRCASLQLMQSRSGSKRAAPLTVMSMSGEEERIACARVLSLENLDLAAHDTLIVPEEFNDVNSSGESQNPVVSLMSGGLVPMSSCPKIAVAVGTTHGRVLSFEFSLQNGQLHRRSHFIEQDVLPYYQPLPNAVLTQGQNREYEQGSKNNTRNRAMSVTSESDDESEDTISVQKRRKNSTVVPFEPMGAVTSITPFTIKQDDISVTHVWISFADGTILRMHHAGLFSSVVHKQIEFNNSEVDADAMALEKTLGDRSLVRCQVELPPLHDTSFAVLPLPKYHPSPLAPFPTWKRPETDPNEEPSLNSSSRDVLPDTYEAIVYCQNGSASTESFPTMAFYTTEDQLEGRIQGGDMSEVKQTTSSSGKILGAVGAFFRGALYGKSKTPLPSPQRKQSHSSDEILLRSDEESFDPWDPRIPFPSMNLSPMSLYCGQEYHDAPRQITFCTVDPKGNLAAAADVLGRVLLVDLSTKQVIRIWKGYRDTTCAWIDLRQDIQATPWKKPSVLYLVIHSRQRRVVEVWRTRHGPRVKAMQVGRDAQLISCHDDGSCYLAHSSVPGGSFHQIERIVVQEDETSGGIQPAKRNPAILRSQEAAIRFNRLQQLLGNTNVPCRSVDVYKTLTHIRGPRDLATALDLLATAPALEEKMKVEGSTFQRLALSHCGDRALDVRDDDPHGDLLKFKVKYYNKVCDAYDIIHKYETAPESLAEQPAEPEPVSAPVTDEPKSNWVSEASGWYHTYKQIAGDALDVATVPSSPEPIKFHSFASSCVSKGADDGVYFSDSSRIRSVVLAHVLKPLLGDVFAFHTVDHLFQAFGIADDHEYLLKCFGEWFMTLPLDKTIRTASFSPQSSLFRWISQIAAQSIGDDARDGIVMKSLFEICRSSIDLVRAFWLATLCREILSRVGEEKEEQTYGKITKAQLVSDWEKLLRQIRVCLLVSLRLYNIRFGTEPISVESVDRKGNFSVYEWLAHDELAMSHDNEEITSLEDACRVSSHSFDPSTSAGDDPVCFKILQSSCLSASISEEERAEYLVDIYDDDKLGALLLFMKPYNNPSLLLAHRALILFTKWGRNPSDLSLMKNGIDALESFNTTRDYKNIAAAVRLDIWQRHIRPVYRAFLFGFDDVQEISAEVVAPLFHDMEWVAQFGTYAAKVLLLFSKIKWTTRELPNDLGALSYPPPMGEPVTWPPKTAENDPVMCRLVKRTRKVSPEAFHSHRAMVSALRVSSDVERLSECIPSFFNMFTTTAIYDPVEPLRDEAKSSQEDFVQNAMTEYAASYSGPVLDDKIELGELETLATLWDMDLTDIRTRFLLAMYESGKDRYVDELLTKVASSMDVSRFCRAGVSIVCRRLHYLLHVQTEIPMHSIMGLLDAELCEWIRKRGSDNKVHDIPVENTHLFALRLLSLAAVSEDIAKEERIQLHSLIVLSGTIVKALESEM